MGAVVSALAFPVPDKNISADMLVSRSHQLVKLETKKRKLNIPAMHIRTSDERGSKFTIIYSHGNAEDVGLSLYYLDRMGQTCDCHVFAYEYPGYSVADGEPSEENCYEAIQAAYEYVTRTLRVDPSKVIVFGRSLGSGPTVDLASRIPDLGGCILQSPLESGIRAVIGYYSSYGLYPLDIFRNYEKVEKIKCPVFIMHGTADRVVPCDNGRALYKTLQNRPWHIPYEPKWIEGRGHNDMPERECLDACRKFLLFLKNRK